MIVTKNRTNGASGRLARIAVIVIKIYISRLSSPNITRMQIAGFVILKANGQKSHLIMPAPDLP